MTWDMDPKWQAQCEREDKIIPWLFLGGGVLGIVIGLLLCALA